VTTRLDETNEFRWFHTYQRLAREGKVTPLVDSKGHEYTIIKDEGELVLFCPYENLTTIPGASVYHQVERGVMENQ
jgi:hypothetical protein